MRYVIFVAFAILIGGAIIPVKTQLLAPSIRVPCDQVGAVAAAIRVVLDGINKSSHENLVNGVVAIAAILKPFAPGISFATQYIIQSFDDLLVKILLLAAVISFVLALFEEEEDNPLNALGNTLCSSINSALNQFIQNVYVTN